MIGSVSHHTFIGMGAGIIGAVLGTLGGAEARTRLVAANGGKDRPVAIGEDIVAIGAAVLIVVCVP